MAYEVTATRRRPQQFEDLAGQEFVAETLKNSIKTKQFAHAYLFTGPRGCGKTSTARILAKALNCQGNDGPTCTPCGQCESCKAITASSSMDVIEIDGASNNGVNDVRQIKDEVMFPPVSARYKIYIIDEVHMLSSGAFNALLKTIEEPPAHVIFIFATTELQKVPATIKSRCQQYNFRLVASDRLKELLSDACREMNIQADDEALYWIAKESGGSVRDCYTLFDQIVAFSDGHITYDKIRDKLGLLGVDRLNSIFESCVAGNSEEVMNQLDSFLQSGISIEQLISNSSEYLRSLLLIKNGIRKESLLGQSVERYSQAVLNGWNTIQTERGISIFLQLYRDIRYSLSPRYELELAFSRLCWLKQYVSPGEVKAAVDKAQALLGGAPAAALNKANATAANSTPVTKNENARFAAASDSNAYGSFSSASINGSLENNLNRNPSANEKIQENLTSSPVNSENSAAENNFVQANSAPQNGAAENSDSPMGLHFFSALSGGGNNGGFGGANAGSGNNSEPTAITENPNPFYKGGAVPPEQTAVNSSYYGEDYGTPEDGSFAPAEEDWPGSSYPENDEDIASSYEEAFESQKENILSPDEIHQSDEFVKAGDGTEKNLKDIYETVITELTKENPMAGSAIMQTGKWKLNGNVLSSEIESAFQMNSIKNAIPRINSIISNFCKTNISFEILKKENKIEESHVEIPAQVEMLCDIFKGTIVGGRK